MRKILRSFLLCVAVLTAASCANIPKRNMSPSVMVIPSRYTVVQLAFDIARMRPVTLVAYDAGSSDGLMHIWNSGLQEWVKIDMSEYAVGNITDGASTVYILGDNTPEGIVEASNWCPDVQHIESLGIVEVITSLHNTMRFSKAEWKRMGKQHGLTVKDRNAERRRYGKYGKPGAKRTVQMPEEEIVEEIGGEPMPPAPEMVEKLPPMVAPEDK